MMAQWSTPVERLEAFFKTGEPIAKRRPFEAPGSGFVLKWN